MLSVPPVLVYPKFGPGCTFILETDASTTGLGAVLSQEQDDGTVHPIAYASRSVDKHERKYGISKLETLGLVWAVRCFRPYILGHPCIVYTDHTACLSILNTARPSGKLARWTLVIQEMDLTSKHKSGKKNTNADALSHCTTTDESKMSVEEQESSKCSDILNVEEISKCQNEDENISALIMYLVDGTLPEEECQSRRII